MEELSTPRTVGTEDPPAAQLPKLEEMARLAGDLSSLLERAEDGLDVGAVLDTDAMRRLTLLLSDVAPPTRGSGDSLAALMARDDAEPTPMTLPEARLDAEWISRPVVDATIARLLSPRMDEPCADAVVDDAVPVDAERPEVTEQPSQIPNDQLFDTLLGEIDRRASLQGTSGSLSIQVVLSMIGDSKKTGELHVRTANEHLRFDFARGAVVATQTDAPPPGQRLGDLVVDLGMVSSATRDAAVEEAVRTSRPLGAVLVEQGMLTIPQLSDALLEQVQARFDRVFCADFVAYAFINGPFDEGDGRLRLSAGELLIRSACRADETPDSSSGAS